MINPPDSCATSAGCTASLSTVGRTVGAVDAKRDKERSEKGSENESSKCES